MQAVKRMRAAASDIRCLRCLCYVSSVLQTVASLRSLSLTSTQQHPDLTDDIPLLESFHRAQQQYQQIQVNAIDM